MLVDADGLNVINRIGNALRLSFLLKLELCRLFKSWINGEGMV